MKQQIIASLLAMCLVAGLLPTAALAAEDEVPDCGIPIVCTMDKNCKAESHDEGCPLYVTPEEPVEDAEEPLAEGSESPAPADPAVTALQKRINALPGVAELAEVDEDEWAAVYEEVCAIYDAIDELTSKEAEALDMSVLEAAAAFFTQQIMPLDGGNDATAMSGNCGAEGNESSVTWKLEQNNEDAENPTYTLVISGNGAMADFPDAGKAPWYQLFPDKGAETAITKIEIGKDVTIIGANAFVWCKAVKDVKFEVGSALKEIHLNGFHALVQLTSIDLPASLVEIGGGAFYGCTALQTVAFQNPDQLTIIEESAFGSCKALLKFNSNVDGKCDIPQNVVTIGDRAFQYCTSLTDVTIPAGVETLRATFYSCSALTSVTFAPNSKLKHLSGSSSSNVGTFTSTSITSITLPDSVETIGRSSFQRSKLTSITIPARVQSIGIHAFAVCPLTSVIFAEDSELKEIGQEAFVSATVNEFIIPEGVELVGNNILQNGKVTSLIRVPSTLKAGFTLGWVSTSTDCVLDTSRTVHQITPYSTNQYKIIYVPNTDQQSNYPSQKTFAVTNGGFAVGSIEDGKLMDVERNGYIFAGWYDNATFTGNTVTTPEAGKTYYAKWVSEITFDSNGGTGSMDAQRIAETDTSTKLTQNTFTRDGYEFSGWNTAADGSGTSYNDEATGAGANGKITLYAQWTKKIGENSYTVNAILDQTYTGSEIKPTVVVKNGGTVLSSGYTVTYSNNTDVGTATATVAIGSDTAEVEFKIVKDENPIVEMADQSVTYGTEYTMTATAKTSAGNEITGGAITIQYYTDENCTTGETDTAPTSAGTYYAKATLTGTDNYAEATKTAKITISNATFSVSATGYDGTYDGRAHSITVEADNDVTVTYCKTENGDYTSEKPEYTDAGEYTVYYKASKANHNDVTGSATVKIAKVQTSLTLTADPAKMTGAGTVKLTLSSTGIPETETIAAPTCEGVTVAANSDGTYSVSLLNETKEYTFAVSYAGDGNHEAAEATCTVSVTRRSSGGGGSSSGGSSSGNTTTEAEKNPDGSTTTTVTDKKTGTVTETTKFKDGSTLVVETKKDGTVTTTETAKNGVKVKTVDEPGENVTAAVTIPKSVGTATVTIPADVDYGMVAVDAETGEIVKLSVPTEDGMTVKLDGSAELVLVDNVKDFADTSGHWAQDGVDFATAHELFSGTSATTFAPDSPMTRAMLMTVLARFDGEDTVGGSVWYEKGMAWAVANGVSDGTDPDGSITREQLATMLYRYMGAPGTGGSIDYFTDSANVSGYAVDAMRWSVETGLISGMGDGSLNPQGNATRAQVAVILMRFTENLTK